MCIILPVDHIPCTHTVAIWQHCVDAPRLAQGLKPCRRIRQHPRPILTRKLCYHCGGPRYFARRGGIAERGSGSPTLSDTTEEKDEHNEQYDSGYQSDVIHEEDEEADDDDVTLSPRASVASTIRWRDSLRQHSSSRNRSSSRRSSWKPNLKRELSAERSLYRRGSIDSTISRFDVDNGRISHTPSLYQEPSLIQRSLVPNLRSTSPNRKNSTLLHPSSPRESISNARPATVAEPTPPSTPPERPGPPPRQNSSLLHPSSPELGPTPDVSDQKSVAFTFSLPTPASSPQAPTSKSAPCRPSLGPRKNSTLLHPSSPPDESPASIGSYPFPILAKTFMSVPPTPQPTPTQSAFERRQSILHSALSDDEWEPLHSSMSDDEYESDDHSAEADTESFHDNAEDKVVGARTGRTARASQSSLQGNHLRILVD